MDIYYHKFSLKPRQELNRLAGKQERQGVFLKSTNSYWEYFPHPELGDPTVDEFLERFPIQDHPSTQKALSILKAPLPKNIEPRTFQNHYLWLSPTEEYFPVIKYKLKSKTDRRFVDFNCDQLRLDANGLFDHEEWTLFESSLSSALKEKIDYVEDPLQTENWSCVGLRSAQDFIPGAPATFTVYKPYRDFFPRSGQVIFSGNMGHALSQYLSYIELIELGQLSLVHGLINPPLYEDVPQLFQGDHRRGFNLRLDATKKFLQSLENIDWRMLCRL